MVALEASTGCVWAATTDKLPPSPPFLLEVVFPNRVGRARRRRSRRRRRVGDASASLPTRRGPTLPQIGNPKDKRGKHEQGEEEEVLRWEASTATTDVLPSRTGPTGSTPFLLKRPSSQREGRKARRRCCAGRWKQALRPQTCFLRAGELPPRTRLLSSERGKDEQGEEEEEVLRWPLEASTATTDVLPPSRTPPPSKQDLPGCTTRTRRCCSAERLGLSTLHARG